jgi:hypothetical protein
LENGARGGEGLAEVGYTPLEKIVRGAAFGPSAPLGLGHRFGTLCGFRPRAFARIPSFHDLSVVLASATISVKDRASLRQRTAK